MRVARLFILAVLCLPCAAAASDSPRTADSPARLLDDIEKNSPAQTNWREVVRQDLLNSCIRQLTRCSEALRRPSKK
jgi:hypothetical protein